jgi:hypothetical protein
MLDGDQTGRLTSATVSAGLAVLVGVIELAARLHPDRLSEWAIQQILTKERGKTTESSTCRFLSCLASGLGLRRNTCASRGKSRVAPVPQR